MKPEELSGKIQTVLGLIQPMDLGVTLTHEHLSMTFDVSYMEPEARHEKRAKGKFELQNMGFIRQYPYSHKENLQLYDAEAITDELKYFKSRGGSSMVENSTVGLGRDMQAIIKMAQDTNVNIIKGTGFYVDASLPKDFASRTLESLVDEMRADILVGCDGTSARCGVVGEVGCSWPLTDNERKSLQASAYMQTELGCPVIIHPGRNPAAPLEIIRVLQEAGGDISKTIMSHLDRTIWDYGELLELAATGCYCEYDLFGIEVSHYQSMPTIDMYSDAQRIRALKHLIDNGYEDKICIAQDIHTLHRLVKYGGHGYSHILDNILPMMKVRGITQQQIDKMLIGNPRTWLTFK
eukprot:GHVU01148491.1.p1 GENE.GHVU01148491.1~~GHVU01148491.1.p1  ORF type:complete len:351 (+),score=41.60 GHVU01148491.1:53-1105(+)